VPVSCAISADETFFEALRFADGVGLCLVDAFAFGDLVPGGDDAAGVGVEALAAGVTGGVEVDTGAGLEICAGTAVVTVGKDGDCLGGMGDAFFLPVGGCIRDTGRFGAGGMRCGVVGKVVGRTWRA
jgi:hypothetical protein